jgi:hypothetical protein
VPARFRTGGVRGDPGRESGARSLEESLLASAGTAEDLLSVVEVEDTELLQPSLIVVPRRVCNGASEHLDRATRKELGDIISRRES